MKEGRRRMSSLNGNMICGNVMEHLFPGGCQMPQEITVSTCTFLGTIWRTNDIIFMFVFSNEYKSRDGNKELSTHPNVQYEPWSSTSPGISVLHALVVDIRSVECRRDLADEKHGSQRVGGSLCSA
jgi:hypothetical protein